MIVTADHDVQDAACAGRTRPVRIGPRAFVGSRATILPGVTIGEASVVCAGAVVTRDVEPFDIVAGVPARRVGRRVTDLRYEASYARWFA